MTDTPQPVERTASMVVEQSLEAAYREYNVILSSAEQEELRMIWVLPAFQKFLAQAAVAIDGQRASLQAINFMSPDGARTATQAQGRIQGTFRLLEMYAELAEIK